MQFMMMNSSLSVVILCICRILSLCHLQKCYMCIEANGFFMGFYLASLLIDPILAIKELGIR
ncbi:uncharacterized protein BO80DRAFT_72164 [Aspergillus ibericus CBS 121593]|uniref:Uncharacterized protein n=1 Tax=Aspergillus ibericus CBS 121593 TaxID=1448316 RepID=A0A395H001_9EURO|nr:hypothetical protein BO80DRAFT_72164 [Aspergillus ibericus CBS 121593]RAL01187.1 hypothetical protein BO80DRAFT_72164 [Aspergillus ibericus CBS 121593]